MKDSEELMNEIRKEARFLAMRRFKQMKLDDFKIELRDHIQHILYQKTQRSPIVISVVNVVGSNSGKGKPNSKGNKNESRIMVDGKPVVPKPEKDFETS